MSETDTSYFNKKYTYADIDEATPPVRMIIGCNVQTDMMIDLPSFPDFTYEKEEKQIITV